jgi:hypothetical protein
MTRVFWFVLALAGPLAHAEPWLCSLSDGRKEFSYDPESALDRRCVDHPISRGYVRKPPREGDPYASPADFPRIDAKTQKKRDFARRDILQRELAEERKALADATRELAELKQVRVGAAAASVLRQYEERIRVHRTNIANLEKELGKAG